MSRRAPWLRGGALAPVAAIVRIAALTGTGFRRVGGIERAMILAAQAFVALLPLLVVTAALVPGGDADSFGDRMVRRFDLEGGVADSIRELFAPAGNVRGHTTGLGVALLLVSAYTFARRVQALYLAAWDLPATGMRHAWRPLAWLVLVTAYLSTLPAVREAPPGWRGLLLAGAAFALWLATPVLLLAGRIPWPRLVPSAALTAVVMTAMSAVAAVYLPRALVSSTAQFGPIGAAYSIVSWLVVVSLALVVATLTGAALVRARGAPVQPTDPG